MIKFRGELSELQTLVNKLGYVGEWKADNGKQVFRSEDGAVLNWWPSTKTIHCQGATEARTKLESQIDSALSGNPVPKADSPPKETEQTSTSAPPATAPRSTASNIDSKRVFVVYGHDETSRDQLELVLHRLDLEPFVLGLTSGRGLTIIEALEDEILHPSKEERFGMVLLTPDDMGYKQADGPTSATPRARQNVVMEMGMLIAAFGRDRVAILKKGHLEVPSDASGIIYLPFNNHVKEVAPKLCQRLQDAGFQLSPDSIAKASS